MPFASQAQTPAKVWRIGMLETTSITLNGANLDAFRQGLREAGYVEGQNLIIEYRSADGRGERFAEMANELAALKVDLIVTRGTPAALAAKTCIANDSRRHGQFRGPRWQRCRRHPCAARWECHGTQ